MTTSEPSQQKAIAAMAAHITERVKRGEAPDSIRADLIAQGLSEDLADQFLAGAAPAGRWESGVRGRMIRTVGVVVMLGGAFLWLGNQIGFFTSLPMLGTVTVFIGAGIVVFGGGGRS